MLDEKAARASLETPSNTGSNLLLQPLNMPLLNYSYTITSRQTSFKVGYISTTRVPYRVQGFQSFSYKLGRFPVQLGRDRVLLYSYRRQDFSLTNDNHDFRRGSKTKC